MCTEIEHIVWIGGDSLISHLFEEAKFLQFLANTVAHQLEPDLLRLQSLQTIAVICRISEESSNKFRENGCLSSVMEVVCGDDLELVCRELYLIDNDDDHVETMGCALALLDVRHQHYQSKGSYLIARGHGKRT